MRSNAVGWLRWTSWTGCRRWRVRPRRNWRSGWSTLTDICLIIVSYEYYKSFCFYPCIKTWALSPSLWIAINADLNWMSRSIVSSFSKESEACAVLQISLKWNNAVGGILRFSILFMMCWIILRYSSTFGEGLESGCCFDALEARRWESASLLLGESVGEWIFITVSLSREFGLVLGIVLCVSLTHNKAWKGNKIADSMTDLKYHWVWSIPIYTSKHWTRFQ